MISGADLMMQLVKFGCLHPPASPFGQSPVCLSNWSTLSALSAPPTRASTVARSPALYFVPCHSFNGFSSLMLCSPLSRRLPYIFVPGA